MPQVSDTPVFDFIHPKLPNEVVPPPVPGVTEFVPAALRQENDVVNFFAKFNEQHFPEDPNFDEVDALKRKGLLEQGELFLGARSEAEQDWKINKVAKEQADRDTLSRAGWPGFVAMGAAGMLSPTSLIPFLRAGTGARSVLVGAASVMSGAVAQEAILMANQESRTKGEAATSIAASVVLGGVLGGIAHTLGKAGFGKLADGMARSPGDEAISAPVPFTHESAVGADVPVAVQDVGKMKEGWGAGQLSRLPITQNPIIRGLQQWNAPAILREAGGSSELRKLTAGFSQDSLTLTGNTDWKAASPGGNVEDLKRTYGAVAYAGHQAIEGAYLDYMKVSSGLAKLSRAQIRARVDKTKLSYPEFKRQIALDIWSNFKRENVPPEIRKAATELDKRVYKHMYDEGVQAGIFTGEEKVVGDENYANRLYKHRVIMQRHEEFVKILADHYRGGLEKEFSEASEKLRGRMLRDTQQLEDMGRPMEELKKLRDELTAQKEAIEAQAPFEVQVGQAVLKDLRKEMLALRQAQREVNAMKVADPAAAVVRQSKLDEIEAQLKLKALHETSIREEFGPELDQYANEVKAIRRRLYNLARANDVVDEKLQKVLSRIEDNEDAQVNTILRARKQLEKFVKFLEKGSDKEIEKELSNLKNSFEGYGKKFDRIEEEFVKLEQAPEAINLEAGLTERQTKLSEKMDDFAAKIEDLDSFDREGWRAEVDQMMKDLADTSAQVNAKRAVRNEKLWTRAEKLSPEAQAKRVEAFRTKAGERKGKFTERWRGKGAEEADLAKGAADFTVHADEFARNVVKKILGTDRRLAYSDIIRGERGPELARLLNIPSEKIVDFLEDDVEKMIAVYTRTMGADLALMKVFKSLDLAEPLLKLDDEKQAILKKLSAATTKDGKPRYTPDQLKKESESVIEFYNSAQRDLLVLLERTRGVRGIPQDADSWSYRAARIAMDLNYLRFMGGVLISSVPDVGRVVMKYGVTRVMKDAVVPMLTNFKTIRMSQREAILAGTALDQVMHTRMYSIADTFDDAHRGTKLERGLHLMSSRLGTFGLFDQWNSGIKQITAGVVNAKILDSIAMVMGDVKAGAKELRLAQEFLARNNIDEEIATAIWGQVTNGKGGGKVNGVWLPNTESWDVSDPAVKRARQAYRAALGGEVDATIITPGLGRPNWVDEGSIGRMLAQFKSYGLVSTQKLVMAGLQEHDAAFFTGVTMSLGLGMLSYYLWAISVGGKAQEEMLRSIEEGNWEKWADEAISRSGVLGVFSEVQRIAERVPMLRQYANLSGAPSTRRDSGDLTEALLGPSFDLLSKASGFISGLDEPTKNTLHQLRLMLPFQNLFYFRQLLDAVEGSAPLPEKRSKEK